MIKIVHLTDTHFDFLSDDSFSEYTDDLSSVHKNVDVFIHSGDISQSFDLKHHLLSVSNSVQAPLLFVLGNHDFYQNAITPVRNDISKITGKKLMYLSSNKPVIIKDVAIIGHDCWYDARIGNPYGGFALNDWRYIEDFAKILRQDNLYSMRLEATPEIIEYAQCLAEEGVAHIERNLIDALKKKFTKIVVVSHAPPFAETHVFNGKMGQSAALPWYTCKVLGDLLIKYARDYPNVEFLTLHGHTHGFFDKKILPNLRVHVGGSEYTKPSIGNSINF